MSSSDTTGARTRARELMLQALYQKQLAGHSVSELVAQFRDDPAYQRIDRAYFDEVFPAVCESQAELLEKIAGVIDRPLAQLDPVEVAVLLIGVYELDHRSDVPYRVVINECVNLAKRFGATDGHKYINACLDVAARNLRPAESGGSGHG